MRRYRNEDLEEEFKIGLLVGFGCGFAASGIMVLFLAFVL